MVLKPGMRDTLQQSSGLLNAFAHNVSEYLLGVTVDFTDLQFSTLSLVRKGFWISAIGDTTAIVQAAPR